MQENGFDKIFINPSFVLLHTLALTDSFNSPFEKFIFHTV